MFPDRPEMQKAGPSTRVTVPALPPREGLEADVQGLTTAASPSPGNATLSPLPAMRIAEIAPPWFTVPPAAYGGIELVVALLADGLTAAGHDVTLFASGGSDTKARLVSPMVEVPEPARLGNG